MLAKLLTSEGSDTDITVSGEAIRAALMAVKLKPDYVDARDLLASMYMRSGKYKLAIEQSRLALQYAPSDRTAIYHLIISLRNSNGSQQGDEMSALIKRLSELQQASLKQDTDRKRYKLEEQQDASPQ